MKVRVLLAVGLLVLVTGGCPEGIGLLNSLTIHNQGATDIYSFTITRTGDVGEKAINILPEPIEPGETFTKSGLVDGVYAVAVYWVNSSYPPGYEYISTSQAIEGGGNHDWYITENADATPKAYVLTDGGPVFVE